jgi:dynein heavy chain 2
MPPEAVPDVLSGVLRLMGNQDNSWNAMKKFLQDRSVISNIVNFDARRITPAVRENVAKLVNKKAHSF